MSDALIDWEQLEMIFGEEEDEFDEDMAELFQEFLEDAVDRFKALFESEFSNEREVVAKEAHKLKGSSANFGFADVASHLANIENNIESLSQDDFESSLAKAKNSFSESQAAVEGRYPALAC